MAVRLARPAVHDRDAGRRAAVAESTCIGRISQESVDALVGGQLPGHLTAPPQLLETGEWNPLLNIPEQHLAGTAEGAEASEHAAKGLLHLPVRRHLRAIVLGTK